MRNKKIIGVGAISALAVVGIIIVLTLVPLYNSKSYGLNDFPDFYTKTEDYFITRIGDVPQINELTYELEITGSIDNPTSLNLSQLRTLPMFHFPLTIETIGNSVSGLLVSTANWTGFSIYDLLNSLGLKSNATGVKYYAADGYFATHTLEQLTNNSVIGALFINNQTLPPVQGFPLRIINPGYYGAKQPAWVIKMEVIDTPLQDYWDLFGWDTTPKMHVDSKIFFPRNIPFMPVKSGDSVIVGGTAYGGTRISKVEYHLSGELDWHEAEIIKKIDVDNVWVFWLINFTITGQGSKTLYVKATDIFNNTQPQNDPIKKDGENSWPSLNIEIT